MNQINLSLFTSFAKGAKNAKTKGGNCVIYTRVSTKEQADNNMSLNTQKKACEVYATKQGYTILGYFGGTYESAKTDERKEFNNMLSFVKKSSKKISYIIVYSVDRFSRSGANAIYIAEQLKQEGIALYAVTQPTDTSTASGSLQQNIQFIFSEYDNQLRREKSISGMKEMLLRGEWCCKPPIGYDILYREGRRDIIINAKGKLIKKAFYWKAKEKLSSEEIRRRLGASGFKICSQKLSELLRNPFYCGLMVHNLLDGQIVTGKHEKLISEELFLEVNGIMAQNTQGYSINPENEEIPLKRFLKCDSCGEYLRAYKAWKNKKYYYKCNTVGCKCNKRADKLHEQFRAILDDYSVELTPDRAWALKEQMIATYHQLNEDIQKEREAIKKELAELSSKIERLEERYVMEEITGDMYDKYSLKFKGEKAILEKRLSQMGQEVSNLGECIDSLLELCANLAPTWDSSDYMRKQELQFLVFPEGIFYNRKNEECRTGRVNEVFAVMASLSKGLEQKETGNNQNNLKVPGWVPQTGIEPVLALLQTGF
jgi:site-specific DNA recombinase